MQPGAEEAQPRCSSCGRPLVGRDRYEGKCAECREADALKLAAARGGPPARCIACGAENPPGQVACSVCGASLLVPARRFWPWVLAALTAAAGVAAAFLFITARPQRSSPGDALPMRPPSRPRAVRATPIAMQASRKSTETRSVPAPSPSDEARVREESRELLALIAKGDYDRAIDNYLQSDEGDFARAQAALAAITDGDARQGFLAWTARLINEGRSRVAAALRKIGDPDPAWSVAFLAHMARSPEVSSPHVPLEDRTRAAIKWHLKALFEGLEPLSARLAGVRRTADGRFVVAVEWRDKRAARWLRNEPTHLTWEKQAVGWVLKVSLADRLERLRQTLRSTTKSEGAQGR